MFGEDLANTSDIQDKHGVLDDDEKLARKVSWYLKKTSWRSVLRYMVLRA